MRILVVDDDPGMTETLVDILEDMGHDVDAAEDGYRAVDMAKGRDYDAALIDIRMPGMNGVEAFMQVKGVHPGTRVAMMTAFTTDELINKAYREGACDVFFKPLEMERVMAFIEGSEAPV